LTDSNHYSIGQFQHPQVLDYNLKQNEHRSGYLSSEIQKPEVKQKLLNHLPISSIELGKLIQDMLSLETPIRLKATGSSMTPFIRDGDVLTISPKSKINPSLGKVVAFVNAEKQNLLIHRIIKVKAHSLLIKGDNSYEKTDGWIDRNQILGCVTRIERDERDIRFGLGVERYLLAFLSRHRLLKRITSRISIILKWVT
jgi:hypothetical protein